MHLVLEDLDTPVYMTSWIGNPNVLVVAERGTAKIIRYEVAGGGIPGGPPGAPASGIVLDLSQTAHGIGQDSAGDLYVMRVDSPNNETLNNGTIYKIIQ